MGDAPGNISDTVKDVSDLVLILVFLVLANTAVTSSVSPWLRAVVVFPFILFVPGYVVTSALFPETDRDTGRTADDALQQFLTRPTITPLERVVLAVAMSIVTVIATALGIVLSPGPFNARWLLPALTVLVLVGTALAVVRRLGREREERFTVPIGQWMMSFRPRRSLFRSTYSAVMSVLLVVALVSAAVSVGFADELSAGSSQEEGFTEFFLLSENGEGDLIADNYPQEFQRGEERILHVGVANHEGSSVKYIVVAKLQRVETDGNEVVVQNSTELARVDRRVAADDSWLFEHSIEPETTGTRLRLVYFLYRGEAPTDATGEDAYRKVHLWITVSDD